MNLNQQRFCDLYLANGNATESYLQVYATNNRKTASTESTKLLRKQEVKEYIADRRRQEFEQTGDIKTDLTSFLQSVILSKTEKTADKLRATELLAKMNGLLNSTTTLEIDQKEQVLAEQTDTDLQRLLSLVS